MTISKKEVLDNSEEVKKFIEEAGVEKEEKTVGIAIKTIFGSLLFQSTKTTLVEAIRDANLREADLNGADLRGADLRDANLIGADLRDADLREADLNGADLNGADLIGADLNGADLRDANLREAELMDAKFYGRGGHKKLTRSQLPYFLTALGFDIVD